MPQPLQREGSAARAAAHVQHAAAAEAQEPALERNPLAEGSEIELRAWAHIDEAVVSLDDLARRLATQVVEHHPPVRILVSLQHRSMLP